MPGKIKELIDNIILHRSKGNPAIAEMTKAKFILKGLNPTQFNRFSADDPQIIERVLDMAGQLNVNNLESNQINIRSAFSNKTDEKEAVTEIINQLRDSHIKVLIFFASSCFDHSKLIQLLQEAFMDCVVFGCSTAGEIINGNLINDSLVVMTFNSNIIADAKAEVIENLRGNLSVESAFTSFERYFHESSYTMEPTRYVGIVLIDGVSMKEEKVMDQIGNRTNVYFIGGSAGDDLKFVQTFVCAKGKAYTDAAVLVLLKVNDHAEFGIIKIQSFKSLDHVFVANKVNEETREVIEFNNKPAILAYAEAVGATSIEEAPNYFINNPVGLVIGENEVFVRSPLQKKGTNMQFNCNLLEGMEVRLLEATNIVEDTKNAIERKMNEFGRIDGIINFHCIGRTFELKKKNLVKQYGEIFSNIPTIGFSTYGEEYIGHINQTSTMLVFKNKMTKPYICPKLLSRKESDQFLYFRINEKLIKENCELEKEVLQLNQELEETTAALREFNIMLEEEINERAKIEQALKIAGDQFSKVFHLSPYLMIIMRSSDDCCIDVNQRYLSTMGVSRWEIIGKSHLDIGVSKNDYEEIIKFIHEQGHVENIEYSRSTKQGTLTFILSGQEIIMNGEQCILFAFNDITEMKQIQNEMACLDRLNLIGQMAAGIAHEIRNPMTTIRGYLQLLGAKPELSSHRSSFKTMIEEVDRANTIITEFLSLAKNRPTEMKCQNINDILAQLYPLIEADAFTQNKRITFEAEKTPDILLNAKEISQLVLNLCRNGLDSMQERGMLTIRTCSNGEQVVFSVQDEGSGIPAEYINKLGTPFFTTKDNGTGLGLAICYSIAERHQAKIDVKSGISGTTFFVSFLVRS